MTQELLLNLLLIVGIIAIFSYFKLSRQRNMQKKKTESDSLYYKILNSDEYKVKGKFEQ
jgi:preprotein translocase subunit YajC